MPDKQLTAVHDVKREACQHLNVAAQEATRVQIQQEGTAQHIVAGHGGETTERTDRYLLQSAARILGLPATGQSDTQ